MTIPSEVRRSGPRWFWSVTTLLVTGLVLWGALRLPLAEDVRTIAAVDREPGTIELSSGDRVTQTFRAPGPMLRGIRIYATEASWSGQPLRLRLVDETGRERFRSTDPRLREEDKDVLRLDFPHLLLSTTPGESLTLELLLLRGNPLVIRTVETDVIPTGALEKNGQVFPKRDLALAASRPGPLSPAGRASVLIGAIAAVGTLAVLLLPARVKWFGAAAFLLLLILLTFSRFWWSDNLLGINDWDIQEILAEAARRSATVYGELPLWNPYLCGGTTAFADPTFPVLSPVFPLVLAFGTISGLRLAIFLFLFIGGIGMLLVSRRLGLSWIGAVVAGMLFVGGSRIPLHLVEGHIDIAFSALLLPWLFWAIIRAIRTPSSLLSSRRWWNRIADNPWVLLVGALLALLLNLGGIYILLYAIGVLLLLVVVWPPRRRTAHILLQSVCWAAGYSAMRIVPVLLWLRDMPDAVFAGSQWTFRWLPEILLGRHLHGAHVIPGQEVGWHEYGAYVGIVALLFVIVGIMLRIRERSTRILVGGLVAAVVLSASGPFVTHVIAPLSFLPRSNISRVMILGIFALALLAGKGLEAFLQRSKTLRLAPLILGFLAADVLGMSFALSEQPFIVPDTHLPPLSAQPIMHLLGDTAVEVRGTKQPRLFPFVRAGYGTLASCGPTAPGLTYHQISDVRGSVDTEDIRPFATLANEQGTAEVRSWSPNRIQVHVEAAQDTVLVLNMNAAPGWTVHGATREPRGGLLAARMPAGMHEIEFRYRPPGLFLGMAVTLAAISMTILFLRRRPLP